jgi:glycosyltransferase involved in cell wall biosynthesis
MTGVRVLHVVATSQRRGAEIFAVDLVQALDGMGIAQRVAILRSNGSDSIAYRAPAQPLGGGGLERVIALRRLVRRLRPHVIQAHGGEAMKASVLASVSVPIVYRRIGGAPPALRRGWRRRAFRHLVGRTARVIAVAEAVRGESISLLRVPPSHVVTIPNGVDPDRLAARRDRSAMRAELGIDSAAPVFVSIAALTWEKDPLAHLRAGASVLRSLPQAVHLFVGDGPMRSRLKREVSSLGLDDRIQILGIRSDVPDLLMMADALLFASRPDGMEGMPAAVIEAGMMRTPSAAYDVAGVGEVVLDGTTGRLVPWGQEEALSAALLDLLRDDFTRKGMGEAARTRCLTRFSIDHIAARYLDVYREVLGMKSDLSTSIS